MGMRVGPNPVDVRIIEQDDANANKNYRVRIGFRPSAVIIFALSDGGAASAILVQYDGFKNNAGAAQGGVRFLANAASSLMTPALGITIEDSGYVLGQLDQIKNANQHLLCMAFGVDAPVADLGETDATKLLRAEGGYGAGTSFDYDTDPPKYDWIGPTT